MPVVKKGRKMPTKVVNISPQPEPKWIAIDWNKVKNINDIKAIISNMGLGCYDNSPNYEQLKKYLVDVENNTKN
jgi:hypothetical protein